MKKILLSLIIVVLFLAGCKKEEEVGEQKVLRLGTATGIIPYSFKDENDEFAGIGLDTVKEVAKRLNAKLEITDMGFDALIPSVETDHVDIIVGAITITNTRAKRVDFSTSYYKGSKTVMVVPFADDSVTTLVDLVEKRVGVMIGSLQQDILETVNGKNPVLLPTVSDCLLNLENKKVDAVLVPIASFDKYVEQYGEGKLKIAGEPIDTAGVAMAVKKGNVELLEKINKALEKMRKDGTQAKIENKYINVK
ncbi:MAG: ABC transporter substrate-binding protein [Rickettsiales bacterium]|nr:MAG: ABC transporter substrate-binding protein [Rickettsiales bacterium]